MVDKVGKVLGWLDASEPGSGNWMKYVRSTEQVLERNMMAVQVDEQVFYKSVRDIEPGEEMLLYARDALYPEMELEAMAMHKLEDAIADPDYRRASRGESEVGDERLLPPRPGRLDRQEELSGQTMRLINLHPSPNSPKLAQGKSETKRLKVLPVAIKPLALFSDASVFRRKSPLAKQVRNQRCASDTVNDTRQVRWKGRPCTYWHCFGFLPITGSFGQPSSDRSVSRLVWDRHLTAATPSYWRTRYEAKSRNRDIPGPSCSNPA
ncbi:hypothetical protein BaRGS_00022648 [Batillaria attramentaria]|uniref:SET domain-containing protein n=1 Tax=Batillaria attramentaria TaxID=370345 RepID=A0ABD0KG09_9CAEN